MTPLKTKGKCKSVSKITVEDIHAVVDELNKSLPPYREFSRYEVEGVGGIVMKFPQHFRYATPYNKNLRRSIRPRKCFNLWFQRKLAGKDCYMLDLYTGTYNAPAWKSHELRSIYLALQTRGLRVMDMHTNGEVRSKSKPCRSEINLNNATYIQRAWRKCISDPSYHMCLRRLRRECGDRILY